MMTVGRFRNQWLTVFRLGNDADVRFWPEADMPKNAIDVAIGARRTWLLQCKCPLMTAKADIESNQRDQIIHPGRDWLRGRGEDRAHEESSVRPSDKSINNFVCS